MSGKEEIEAPYINLEAWREMFVPAHVWENEYLQAYLKTRQNLVRMGLTGLTMIAFIAGNYFR